MEVLNLDFKIFLLITVGAINFTMGLLVFFKDIKNNSNFFFGLTATGIALWVINRGVFQMLSPDLFGLVFSRFLFVSSSLIGIFFLFFAIYFGEEQKRLSLGKKALIVLPWIITVTVSLWPGLVVDSIFVAPNGENTVSYGPAFLFVFSPFMLTYLLLSIGILIHKFFISAGLLKKTIKIYLIRSIYISHCRRQCKYYSTLSN